MARRTSGRPGHVARGVAGPSTTFYGLADHQHAGLIMKASRFGDPGPRPIRNAGFSPGSWKPGLAWPEATTARHSRNPRTTNAGSLEAKRRVIRGGPYGGRWPIDHTASPDGKRRKPHKGVRRPGGRRPLALWRAAAPQRLLAAEHIPARDASQDHRQAAQPTARRGVLSRFSPARSAGSRSSYNLTWLQARPTLAIYRDRIARRTGSWLWRQQPGARVTSTAACSRYSDARPTCSARSGAAPGPRRAPTGEAGRGTGSPAAGKARATGAAASAGNGAAGGRDRPVLQAPRGVRRPAAATCGPRYWRCCGKARATATRSCPTSKAQRRSLAAESRRDLSRAVPARRR